MYLIKDKTNDPQGLDLLKLIKKIIDIVYKGSNPTWTLTKIRGYGQTVCELEDKVLQFSKIKIKSDKLLNIIENNDQWFYDLQCVDVKLNLKFGVVDSGLLFIDGGNLEEIKTILSVFKEVVWRDGSVS